MVLRRSQGLPAQPLPQAQSSAARPLRAHLPAPTGFVTLDHLLARLHARKDELLLVLEWPEIPLHTNGSENDIRCHVTKRKVSGGTWSEAGRDARDACLGLIKTCQKLGLPFFDYLGSRLGVPDAPLIPPLPNLVRARATP